MLDARLVIHMLLARHHEEPIEGALAAFSIQHRRDLVAGESAAQGKGVGDDVTAAVLVDLQGRHVERGLALLLQPVMVDHGVLARHDLRDRVGEVDLVLYPDVTLHHCCLAATVHHYQVPGVRNGGLRRRRRDKQQVDWGRNTGPRRDMDERPVLHKGRVEGDKGVVLEAGVAGQMRFHAAAIGADGLRQAPTMTPSGSGWSAESSGA